MRATVGAVGLLAAVVIVGGLYFNRPQDSPSEPLVPQPPPQPTQAEVCGETVSLDGFFAGIERGCEKNPTLSRALDSMGASSSNGRGWEASAELDVPEALKSAFGPLIDGGQSDIAAWIGVEISCATYLGLPVSQLGQTLGRETGIQEFSFVVDAPPESVRKALDSAFEVIDSCQAGWACEVGPFQIALYDRDGKTSVSCDTST